jgi:hypothetical protein
MSHFQGFGIAIGDYVEDGALLWIDQQTHQYVRALNAGFYMGYFGGGSYRHDNDDDDDLEGEDEDEDDQDVSTVIKMHPSCPDYLKTGRIVSASSLRELELAQKLVAKEEAESEVFRLIQKNARPGGFPAPEPSSSKRRLKAETAISFARLTPPQAGPKKLKKSKKSD